MWHHQQPNFYLIPLRLKNTFETIVLILFGAVA